MRIKLIVLALLLGGFLSAQTNLDIKSFINKNSEAIHYIQLQIIKEKHTTYNEVFKSLVKNQLTSVALYNSSSESTITSAYQLRKVCLRFLKEFLHTSSSDFELTASEKLAVLSDKKNNQEMLSSSTLNSINSINVLSTNALNAFILTIK